MSAVRKPQSSTRRGTQAIRAQNRAALAEAMPRTSMGDEIVYDSEARLEWEHAELCLTPAEPVTVRAGEAVTWENKADEIFPGAHARIVETLEHPNSISVGASTERTSAALAAGVLEPAIDAALSAQAANSIEKMLCHQLAGAHHSAMRLLERVNNAADLQPVEVVRFTNGAARMMDVYQAGCLTLQKLKSGGTQRVEVQYQQVNVGAGGQAVVACGGSRSKRGGGGKNGR